MKTATAPATVKRPRASKTPKPTVGRPAEPIQNQTDPRGQFAAFLRNWIASNSAATLARELDISTRAVHNWASGIAGPAFGDLNRVAVALGYRDWFRLAGAIERFFAD